MATEELIVIIPITSFVIGLVLVGSASWFEKEMPERLPGYMAATGIFLVWSPICIGGLILAYDFLAIMITQFLGINLPTVLLFN